MRTVDGLCDLTHLTLRTANCIVTGEPATSWTGHVLAEAFGGLDENGRLAEVAVSIVAGFKDEATYKSARPVRACYYGPWKTRDGILWRDDP